MPGEAGVPHFSAANHFQPVDQVSAYQPHYAFQPPASPYAPGASMTAPAPPYSPTYTAGQAPTASYQASGQIPTGRQATQASAAGSGQMQPAQPTANTLGVYNRALASVRIDINSAMTVSQRSLGRSLTIVASIAALGGAIGTGLLGLGALGAVASVVGLPIGAVAGIAAAAVFIGGTAIAIAMGSIARLVVRRSLHEKPEIQAKLSAVRDLRDQLQSRKYLSSGEKNLLKNANFVLGKVDGIGSHLKSQLKLSAKTQGISLGLLVAALPAALAAPFFLGGGGGGAGFSFKADGSELRGDRDLGVNIDGGEALLNAMHGG